MLKEAPVFLQYTKAELDRNFDQRGWIPNALEIIGRHIERSRRAREKLPHVADIRYGQHLDEVLDYFPTAQRNAPVHVFVHGGAWKNFTKSDYSFPAESFVAAGFHTAILNFAKLPTIRLPEMLEQVRRGVAWVYKNAAQYGGNPDRLSLSAHSSGAHLAANALITDWTTFGCPPDTVKAAACVSGPYDLEPVMLSARSSYVELDDTEVAALSINRHTDRIPCPITIAYADGDTDEFRRQSQEFANALRRSGRLTDCRCFAGLNHFEIMEQFGEPESDLIRYVVSSIRPAAT